jgi:hypothetical protein
MKSVSRAREYLATHSLALSLGLLALTLVDFGYVCVALRGGPTFSGMTPFVCLGLTCYVVVMAFYAVLVVSRVAAILRHRHHARTDDLAFFLVVYLNAIFILALCCTGLNALGLSWQHRAMFSVTFTGPIPLDFLYYAAITFTGVGYGDIVPTHLASRMLVAGGSICGHLYGILGIGVVLNSLMQEEHESEEGD